MNVNEFVNEVDLEVYNTSAISKRVKESLVETKLKSLAILILSGLDKLTKLKKSLSKVRPDIITTFNVEHKLTGSDFMEYTKPVVAYSAEAFKQRSKLTETIQKLEQTIEECLDKPSPESFDKLEKFLTSNELSKAFLD